MGVPVNTIRRRVRISFTVRAMALLGFLLRKENDGKRVRERWRKHTSYDLHRRQLNLDREIEGISLDKILFFLSPLIQRIFHLRYFSIFAKSALLLVFFFLQAFSLSLDESSSLSPVVFGFFFFGIFTFASDA